MVRGARLFILLPVMLLGVLLLVSCSEKATEDTPDATETLAVTATAPPTAEPSPKPVVTATLLPVEPPLPPPSIVQQLAPAPEPEPLQTLVITPEPTPPPPTPIDLQQICPVDAGAIADRVYTLLESHPPWTSEGMEDETYSVYLNLCLQSADGRVDRLDLCYGIGKNVRRYFWSTKHADAFFQDCLDGKFY